MVWYCFPGTKKAWWRAAALYRFENDHYHFLHHCILQTAVISNSSTAFANSWKFKHPLNLSNRKRIQLKILPASYSVIAETTKRLTAKRLYIHIFANKSRICKIRIRSHFTRSRKLMWHWRWLHHVAVKFTEKFHQITWQKSSRKSVGLVLWKVSKFFIIEDFQWKEHIRLEFYCKLATNTRKYTVRSKV